MLFRSFRFVSFRLFFCFRSVFDRDRTYHHYHGALFHKLLYHINRDLLFIPNLFINHYLIKSKQKCHFKIELNMGLVYID